MNWDTFRSGLKYAAPIAGAAGGFMIGGPMGAAVGYGLGSGVGGMISSDEQRKAAEDAGALQYDLGLREQNRLGDVGQKGSTIWGEAGDAARSDLERYTGDAYRRLKDGNTTALSRYGEGIDSARGSLSLGYSGAESAINSGYGAATDRLLALASLANDTSPLGSNFEADPGYNFRLQQGESALARAGTAAGGRLSGAALKKLTEYNQGFASNEFNQAAQRDLAMRQMGYGAATTLSGYDVGRGSALANISTSRGADFANLDTALGSYGANLASNQGVQLAGLSTGLGSQLASVGMQTAGGQANALNNAATGQVGVAQGLIAPSFSAALPYTGAGYGAFQGGMNNAANLAMFGYGSGMIGGGGGGGGVGGGWSQYGPNSWSRTTGYGGGSY